MRNSVLRPCLESLFRLLDHFSPHLMGSLAWRLFCTPFNHSKPTITQAHILEQAYRNPLRFGQKSLNTYHWGSSGPAVLMVHGWGGRAHVFGDLIPAILAKGFRVISFDAPAHNGSGGRTNLLEYASAVKLVAREFGPIRALVGHSFGAMTAAYSSLEMRDLEALALVGAPNGLDFVLAKAEEQVAVPDKALQFVHHRIEKLSGRPLVEHSTGQYLQHLDCPKLFIHDTDDQEVPIHQASSLAESLDAEFLSTEGLGHHRILNSPEVGYKLAKFLERHVQG